MIVPLAIKAINQFFNVVVLVAIPLLWLLIVGRLDLVGAFIDGRVMDAFGGFLSIPISDYMRATGLCGVVGGIAYLRTGFYMIVRLPLIGALDRLFARLSIVLGLITFILSYK